MGRENHRKNEMTKKFIKKVLDVISLPYENRYDSVTKYKIKGDNWRVLIAEVNSYTDAEGVR